jgi:uncharacterized membrane protein SpoIIM required for sporulation
MLFVLVCFACAAAIGYLFPERFEFLRQQVQALFREFAGRSAPVFIAKIFLHNLLVAYIAMCLLPVFGLVPLALGVLNGLLIGWAVAEFSSLYGMQIAIMLIPHGIFEIPAMIVAWGIGIWRGAGFRFARPERTAMDRWRRAHAVFLTVVAPLLLVAAVVEGRYHIARQLLG